MDCSEKRREGNGTQFAFAESYKYTLWLRCFSIHSVWTINDSMLFMKRHIHIKGFTDLTDDK